MTRPQEQPIESSTGRHYGRGTDRRAGRQTGKGNSTEILSGRVSGNLRVRQTDRLRDTSTENWKSKKKGRQKKTLREKQTGTP